MIPEMNANQRLQLIVACPNWIGDAVMATPALAALKELFPRAALTLLCRPYVAPIFRPAPYADRLLLWDEPGSGGLLKMARAIRRSHYDAGLLMTNSFRSALALFLGRVPERIGYARDMRSPLLTTRLKVPRESCNNACTPMLQYYFDLVRPLGAADLAIDMKLYTTPDDELAADQFYALLGLDPQTTLLMAPGAAFGLAKCWPPERFAAVARMARADLNLRTAILCSPKEMPMAHQIAAASDGAAVTMPEAGPPLATVKALVRRARAMVTNDSGLRHFAAAYDLPVVTIFGPTHINLTETWFRKETKLQAALPCGPCQKRVCPEGHLQCMNEITPEQVYEALAALVEKFPYQKPRPDNIIRPESS